MSRHRIDGLHVFLAVAENGSFRKASAKLGMTTPAVSQRIRKLETELGVPLFARTTRKVGLTEAGRFLWDRSRLAFAELEDAVEAVSQYSSKPRGTLRLTVPRMAIPLVIRPVLPVFRERFPEVKVEVHVDDSLQDLVGCNYDAGIRLGSMVAVDMVSIELTPLLQSVIVASPSYLKRRGTPKSLSEIRIHDCIGYRRKTSGDVYRWEIMDGTQEIALVLEPMVIVDDSMYMLQAAVDGMGLAYLFDALTRKYEEKGELVRVLEEAHITEPGLHLYFSSRSHVMPKLRAFVDTARGVMKKELKKWHKKSPLSL
jgi:DNA-binding transcriptional LysR family regulator